MTFSNVTSGSFIVHFEIDSTSTADYFAAEVQGRNSSCSVDKGVNPLACLLAGLQSATRYEVKAKACLKNNATKVCSEEADAAESTVPLRK